MGAIGPFEEYLSCEAQRFARVDLDDKGLGGQCTHKNFAGECAPQRVTVMCAP
jgi:hypothetical protein